MNHNSPHRTAKPETVEGLGSRSRVTAIRLLPHFTGPVDISQLPDGRNFATDRSFGLWTPETGLITVPARFHTDLASIPRLFWNILPPFGKYTDAAIVHDFLYRTQLLPRKTADRALLAGMKLMRVPFWQRAVIYLNVRWFGFVAWRDDSRHIDKPQLPRHAVSHCYRHD